MLRPYTVPKNQEFFLPLFKLYLTQTGKNTPLLENELERGVCFGHAICRAAMRISGKLPWWDAAFSAITSWDGKAESLKQSYLLPGSSKVVSLDEIFERILSYIVFNHANLNLYPEIQLKQYSFLLPGGFFEMLDASGNVLKVKKNYKIGGRFSCDNLVSILSDKTTQKFIQNNICLIHNNNPSHTRELGFANGLWSLACADNPGEVNYYYNIYKLADEIGKYQTSIIIELACVNEEEGVPFSYYYDVLIKNQACRLLQTDTIIHFVAFAPFVLAMLLRHLKTQEYSLIDWEQTSRKGLYPLHYAMYYPDLNIAEVLCEAGAYTNVFDSSGYTPLMTAVKQNNVNGINLLNVYGADPNIISRNEGMTALMIAASWGNKKVIKELLENKNMNVRICVPAKVLVLLKDELKPAFENYCKKNPGNIPYFTALHYAVFFGKEEAVKILLPAMGKMGIETLNELWELASILKHENIRIMIDHQLKLQLNLTKRTAESDDNERPLKRSRNSYCSLFKEKSSESENTESEDELSEDYEAAQTSASFSNSYHP